MERVSIFSIHAINPSSSPEHRIISGRALDNLKVGSKLFILDPALDEMYCIVEGIESEAKSASSLGIMEVGTITIKSDDQIFPEMKYLYGELVNKYTPTITLDIAKRMALEASQEELSRYVKDADTPFLSDNTLEGECCWFFFNNPEIEIPEHAWATRMLSVYAISKKGDMRHTYNYSDDPIKLNDYVQAMSSYFKKRGT